MFQRFSDEGLAQSSFLIACDRTHEAAVVDPRRDIDAYVALAEQRGLTIAYAIETHTHADFVSGARELAALGARVVGGPGADLAFPFHEASHGGTLRVGDISLEMLHTPGHTPEHISVLVREPGSPARALTGDTLFVGAVGRPDLLGEDQMHALAESLYDSLFGTLLALSDDVEVHPGHGAGSLCGAGIGKAPQSTIGQERRNNPLLQLRSREAFVAAVLNDLPDTPPYFPRLKILNRAGPPLLGLARGGRSPVALNPQRAAELAARGAMMLDLRAIDAFAAGHPSGALNIAFGPRVGYWAGWILPADSTVVLVVSDICQLEEASRQLLRVGFDDVAGYIEGGYEAWRDTGAPTAVFDLIDARGLRDRTLRNEPHVLVDVRTRREWQAGHLDHAINIPVSEVAARAGGLRGGATVATICESGFRSSLAASVLQRAGVRVINVNGGTAAYRMLDSSP
jgi:hydroxyacylglutathione hydrolase